VLGSRTFQSQYQRSVRAHRRVVVHPILFFASCDWVPNDLLCTMRIQRVATGAQHTAPIQRGCRWLRVAVRRRLAILCLVPWRIDLYLRDEHDRWWYVILIAHKHNRSHLTQTQTTWMQQIMSKLKLDTRQEYLLLCLPDCRS